MKKLLVAVVAMAAIGAFGIEVSSVAELKVSIGCCQAPDPGMMLLVR